VVERLGPPLDEPIFDELAIIGVGLIGSSVARAARKRKAVRRIVLADRSQEALARAEDLALGDETTNDLKVAVRNADCVLLCAPVGANKEISAPSRRR
jgi:cyclohexadieny/prephenate dehydrogenase